MVPTISAESWTRTTDVHLVSGSGGMAVNCYTALGSDGGDNVTSVTLQDLGLCKSVERLPGRWSWFIGLSMLGELQGDASAETRSGTNFSATLISTRFCPKGIS